MTLEEFINFYDEVLAFLRKSSDGYNSVKENDLFLLNVINEKSEIDRKRFFIEYILINLSFQKSDMKLMHAPTKIYQHVLNGIITLLILLAVYVGVLIANINIKKKIK